MAPDTDALKSLESVIQTASTLLKQLQDVLTEIHKNPAAADETASTPSSSTTPVDALALSRDATSLVRAHGTKVSLLIINEPFTPSAIVSVVRELISGPIPGIVSAVQSCRPELYSALFRQELAWRSRKVLAELGDLIRKTPLDGKALVGAKKDGFATSEKGSIASTGLLWSACDSAVELVNKGVGGFFVKKVDEWTATLKDNMEELKEWSEEEPDDEDDNFADDTADGSAQAMLDDLMSSQNTIPADDPDHIRPRLESSIRRLRLTILLFQAVTKRRLKKLPQLPVSADSSAKLASAPKRLDEVAAVLRSLPDRFGDLTNAFYELLPGEIDEMMQQCFLDAHEASVLMKDGWDGEQDEFAEWTSKFQAEIQKR